MPAPKRCSNRQKSPWVCEKVEIFFLLRLLLLAYLTKLSLPVPRNKNGTLVILGGSEGQYRLLLHIIIWLFFSLNFQLITFFFRNKLKNLEPSFVYSISSRFSVTFFDIIYIIIFFNFMSLFFLHNPTINN